MAGKTETSLTGLAAEFFYNKGYTVQEEVILEGFSGLQHTFDLLLIDAKKERTPVWVREWSRTVGVNMVINLDKASSDVNMRGPIMVGEKFSDHAKAYANRRKIRLVTRKDILGNL